MDFASWSPSHTIIAVFALVAFIGQVAVYFYRTAQNDKKLEKLSEAFLRTFEKMEDKIDKQSENFTNAIERLEDKMDKRFVEVVTTMNHQNSDIRTEINEVRSEISKLNQNHIDHLTHHQSEV